MLMFEDSMPQSIINNMRASLAEASAYYFISFVIRSKKHVKVKPSTVINTYRLNQKIELSSHSPSCSRFQTGSSLLIQRFQAIVAQKSHIDNQPKMLTQDISIK